MEPDRQPRSHRPYLPAKDRHEGWVKAGRRLGDGWAKAGRRLGEGWVKQGRLGEGWEGWVKQVRLGERARKPASCSAPVNELERTGRPAKVTAYAVWQRLDHLGQGHWRRVALSDERHRLLVLVEILHHSRLPLGRTVGAHQLRLNPFQLALADAVPREKVPGARAQLVALGAVKHAPIKRLELTRGHRGARGLDDDARLDVLRARTLATRRDEAAAGARDDRALQVDVAGAVRAGREVADVARRD